eukprot:snap_masked-scaffold_5-processed-gene-15.40-mRNA-1 protein AED:0.01 eAED:0.01 QI:104/1/1/1/0.5/0.33/3/185/182
MSLRVITDKLKDFFLFRRGATDFWNRADKQIVGKGYRYPSPGSRGPVNVPAYELDEDPYNTQYYTRDAKRNQPAKIEYGADLEKKIIGGGNYIEGAAAGDNNPAVKKYDETLTRSAMSTTREATELLLQKEVPTHLPVSWWEVAPGRETLEEEAARKGLPPLAGREPKFVHGRKTYDENSHT